MTLVTAVIRDSSGNTYTNALVEASFLSNIPAGTGSGPPLASGSVFQTFSVSETDSFGNLSMNLTDLAVITPLGGSWFFNVLNNARTIGFSMNSFAVTGTTVDLTAAFAAASAPLFPSINLSAIGAITFTEQAAPAGSAGKDVLWGDSTAHRLKVNPNNTGPVNIALASDNLGAFGATTSAQLAGIISDETGSGALVFGTGPVIAPTSQNGLMTVYADQFANVQAAINALPAGGGCVDARSPNVNLALGTIDPGTKPTTLLLGPLSYTCDHIVLQANFRILGSNSVSLTGTGTQITSVGLNTQPLIVNATSGLLNVRGPEIRDLTFIALSGNTSQDGMKLDLSANTALSVIDHFRMWAVNFSGFKGNSIYIKGPNTNNGSFNQFFEFHHVTANRPASSGNSIRITGASGQIDLYSCQFDGNAKGNGTNIYIGTEANADTVLPYSINFYSLTSQASNIDFNGSGFNQVGFFNTHQENTNIVYQLDALHTNSKNGNVVFSGGYFANAGVNAGAGRILKVTTNQTFGVVLEKSTITSIPDRLVESTTGAEVVTHDNNFPQNTTNANITTSVDFQTTPAATLGLGMYHTVMLQASATSITTINSQLGPGELITFFANGTCQFATGGNVTLPGRASPLVLAAGENATFVNSDYTGTNTWRLLGVNTATLTGQSLTSAGNGNNVTLLNSQDPAGNVTGNGTDQTVFTFTIPANTIQAGKGIRVTMAANSNNAVSCAWKLILGATTLISVTTTTVATFSASYIIVNNAGVQNAQNLVGYAFEGSSAVVNGIGTVSSTENFANSLVLKLTANEANPNTVTPKKWLIELVQ